MYCILLLSKEQLRFHGGFCTLGNIGNTTHIPGDLKPFAVRFRALPQRAARASASNTPTASTAHVTGCRQAGRVVQSIKHWQVHGIRLNVRDIRCEAYHIHRIINVGETFQSTQRDLGQDGVLDQKPNDGLVIITINHIIERLRMSEIQSIFKKARMRL